MDLFQVGVNAAAGAFGMGIANELYHAFQDYRKLLKQRLLDDTIVAIRYYRDERAKQRELQRSLRVRRYAKNIVLGPAPSPEPVLATPPIPIRRAHSWSSISDNLFSKPKTKPIDETIAVKREPVLSMSIQPTHLNYTIPTPTTHKKDELDEPIRRMIEWESTQ